MRIDPNKLHPVLIGLGKADIRRALVDSIAVMLQRANRPYLVDASTEDEPSGSAVRFDIMVDTITYHDAHVHKIVFESNHLTEVEIAYGFDPDQEAWHYLVLNIQDDENGLAIRYDARGTVYRIPDSER